MSMTGLEVFDSTIHQTNVWLKAIMDRLDTDDRHRAYLALRATLHARILGHVCATESRMGGDGT